MADRNYPVQEITVTVRYSISFKSITEKKTVKVKATVRDLIYEIFPEMLDDAMKYVYVAYGGKKVINIDLEIVRIGQEKKYFIIRSRVAELAKLNEKIKIMKCFIDNPSSSGNLLKHPQKKACLNFLMPIYDHREGRVGDDIMLYYPGFQKFVDRVKSAHTLGDEMKLTKEDCKLACSMCSKMAEYMTRKNETSGRSEKEKERLELFHNLLEEYLKPLDCHLRTSTTAKSMADLIIDPFQCVQVEVKHEASSNQPDSNAQIIAYYVNSLEVQKDDKSKYPDRCQAPGYLLELIGPRLFISGAVFGQYVFVDELVNSIRLVPPNEEEVARVFKALKYAIEEIKNYYNYVPLYDEPRFPPFFQSMLRYQKRIKRHVFKGLTYIEGEEVDVIIKFTKRYCREAHDLMYKIGYAPRLIHYEERVGGTQYTAVVVRYIKNANPFNIFLKNYLQQYSDPGQKKEELQSLKYYCKELRNTIHSLGFCHGKIKSSSIIVQKIDEKQYNIFLVNYEWAGKIGKASYPSFLHVADIQDGIEPGGPITPEQDEAQLDKIFKL